MKRKKNWKRKLKKKTKKTSECKEQNRKSKQKKKRNPKGSKGKSNQKTVEFKNNNGENFVDITEIKKRKLYSSWVSAIEVNFIL